MPFHRFFCSSWIYNKKCKYIDNLTLSLIFLFLLIHFHQTFFHHLVVFFRIDLIVFKLFFLGKSVSFWLLLSRYQFKIVWFEQIYQFYRLWFFFEAFFHENLIFPWDMARFNLPAFLKRGPSLISQLSSREAQV